MKAEKVLMLACALLTLPLAVHAAQLYRWVDSKGNVEWRDTPPPPSAKKVEQRTVNTSTIQTSELPYSLQQAVRNFPVTLWTTSCGDTCDRARSHLNRRGIPHSEKNPQGDIENFKKASGGSMEVPLLLVGRNQLRGYLENEWDAALDAAGYPRTPLVPARPAPRPSAAPASKTEPAAPQPAPEPVGAPAGGR